MKPRFSISKLKGDGVVLHCPRLENAEVLLAYLRKLNKRVFQISCWSDCKAYTCIRVTRRGFGGYHELGTFIRHGNTVLEFDDFSW